MKFLLSTMMFALALSNAGNVFAQNSDIYSIKVNDIEGKEIDLSQYKGKVLLIVNTASKCGFTPQYKSLEELYSRYKDKGLEVLGFPANNFGNQEPGSNEEIKNFCLLKFKVDFPMFSKVSVKGDDIHPLYKFLTSDNEFGGAIKWNFNKFLIAKDGKVAARFDSMADPLSKGVVSRIEELLGK